MWSHLVELSTHCIFCSYIVGCHCLHTIKIVIIIIIPTSFYTWVVYFFKTVQITTLKVCVGIKHLTEYLER